MDSSSSYHTCISVDITKISPPMDNQVFSSCSSMIPTQKRVEFVDNNNATKAYCNVSFE